MYWFYVGLSPVGMDGGIFFTGFFGKNDLTQEHKKNNIFIFICFKMRRLEFDVTKHPFLRRNLVSSL